MSLNIDNLREKISHALAMEKQNLLKKHKINLDIQSLVGYSVSEFSKRLH